MTNGDESEAPKLTAKLAHLLGEDAIAYANLLDLPDRSEKNAARRKHNDRTARYKLSKALSLAPDSEAIAQACCYLVLGSIELGGDGAKPVLRRLVETLIAAGYEKDEVGNSIQRLVHHYRQRREDWQRRTRQRLASRVIQALSERQGSNK